MKTRTRERRKQDNSKEVDELGKLDFSGSIKGSDERFLGCISHVTGLLGWIVGPLIIYLMSDDEYVKKNAGQSFSWQVNITIYMIISAVLSLFGFGIVILGILTVVNIWLCLVASLKAMAGKEWEYPLSKNYLKK